MGRMLLMAIVANLDSLVVGVSFGCQRIRTGWAGLILMGLITSACTLLSMLLGRFAAAYIDPRWAELAGGALLVAIGIYTLYGAYRTYRARGRADAEPGGLTGMLTHPERADANGNAIIELREIGLLALALSMNNAALGVGASLAGMPIAPAVAVIFALSIAFVRIGEWMGRSVLSRALGRYAEIASGLMIVGLGVLSLLG